MGPEHCQGISCMCPTMLTGETDNGGSLARRWGDWEPVSCHWKAEGLPKEQGTFCLVSEDGMRLMWLMTRSQGPASAAYVTCLCRPLPWSALLLTSLPGLLLSLPWASLFLPQDLFTGYSCYLEHAFLRSLYDCVSLWLVHSSIKGRPPQPHHSFTSSFSSFL